MTSYWYRAYGLRIQSEVRLLVPQSEPAAAPDLVIRFAKNLAPSPTESAETNTQKSLLWATPNEICCKWAAAGTFLMRGGKEILIEPNSDATDDTLAPWIQGSALSLMLHQRGFLVLHSSSVAVKGRAISFLGQVGWGKSTTAAAMSKRGHQLLADDVLAVQVDQHGRPWAVPGFPHLKLMEGAVSFLGENPQDLSEVADDPTKRLRISRQKPPERPLPLAAVYILDEGEPCSIIPLTLTQALLQMMDHLFIARMTEFLRQTDTMASNFRNLTELIRNGSVCKLRRPKSFELLPHVTQMIEEHVLSLQIEGAAPQTSAKAQEA